MDLGHAVYRAMIGGDNLVRVHADRLYTRHNLASPCQCIGIGKGVGIKTIDTLAIYQDIA